MVDVLAKAVPTPRRGLGVCQSTNQRERVTTVMSKQDRDKHQSNAVLGNAVLDGDAVYQGNACALLRRYRQGKISAVEFNSIQQWLERSALRRQARQGIVAVALQRATAGRQQVAV